MPIELSILIPTFNRARYLSRCFELLSKTKVLKTDYEILLLDDGSSDDTHIICLEWQEKGLPLKLHSCPFVHLGRNASRARNIGIRLATGKILAQMEPELLFNIDFPYVMISSFDSKKIKIAEKWCKFGIREQLVVESIWRDAAKNYEQFRQKFNLPKLIPTYPNPHTGSILRKHFLDIQGYDERFEVWGGEDDDVLARLSKLGLVLERIPNYYILHQWHRDFQSGQSEKYKHQLSLIDQSRKDSNPIRNDPSSWGTKW